MSAPTRREFLKYSARLAVLLGLAPTLAPRVARALTRLADGRAPVVWLQGQSCSGCSVSFLNSESPGPAEVLLTRLALHFHSTISAATGEMCLEIIDQTAEQGDFLLVVEGSVPAAMPQACLLGHRSINEIILKTAAKAQAVVALGACAAMGGIPAAEGNPTGAVSVGRFLKDQGVSTAVINLPGCPAHPDWLVGTLVQVLAFGPPDLDEAGRPRAFYGHLVHDQCPRFADYERENFAADFGQPGCLFKLGCLGPVTKADCTLRKWNGGTNTCIMAGGPCIGCAGETFASRTGFPFYRLGEAPPAKG